jgi:hypothetical protein
VETITTNVTVATGVAGFAKNGTGVFASSANGKGLDVAGRATLRADTTDGLAAPSLLVENRATTGTNRKALVAFLTDSDSDPIPDHPAPAAIFAEIGPGLSKSQAIVGRGPASGQTGVFGESDEGIGVIGATGRGVGVRAQAGIGGIALTATGAVIEVGVPVVPGSTVVDVAGIGGGTGLTARAGSGTGMVGAAGRGVGVRGVAEEASGVGVRAESPLGLALEVLGTATFSAGVTIAGDATAASFSGTGAALTGLDAGNVATGVLGPDRVPGLDASKVVAGTLSPARIPGLRASKIARGRLAEARLPRTAARLNTKVASFKNKVAAGQFGGLRGKPPVFTTAGLVPVSVGDGAVLVRAPGLTDKNAILAMLQTDAGANVGVLRVERRRGGFRVVLTGATTKASVLAFFVLGAP